MIARHDTRKQGSNFIWSQFVHVLSIDTKSDRNTKKLIKCIPWFRHNCHPTTETEWSHQIAMSAQSDENSHLSSCHETYATFATLSSNDSLCLSIRICWLSNGTHVNCGNVRHRGEVNNYHNQANLNACTYYWLVQRRKLSDCKNIKCHLHAIFWFYISHSSATIVLVISNFMRKHKHKHIYNNDNNSGNDDNTFIRRMNERARPIEM